MSWKAGSDDEEEELEVKEFNPYLGREGILFLIDARKVMFIKDLKKRLDDDNEREVDYSAFALALEVC